MAVEVEDFWIYICTILILAMTFCTTLCTTLKGGHLVSITYVIIMMPGAPNLLHEPDCFIMLKIQDMKMQEHMKVIQEFGQTLFNSGTVLVDVMHSFTQPYLPTLIHIPASFPKTVQYLFFVLDKLRAQLNLYYKNYNPMKPQDQLYFTPDVHQQCSVLFENALQSLSLWDDDTELIPVN